MAIFEKYGELKKLYPDDIKTIEAEERRVADLLEKQDYSLLPATQELLALCRQDILTARMKLARDRTLSDAARAELWHIIDARQWFVQMVAKDYEAELAQIEVELEAELSA